MELDLLELTFEEKVEKTMSQLLSNLSKIQAGRANPAILNAIKIDYYDTMTPLNQVANISVPEPRQLLIKPFEMDLVKTIVGAINSAQMGFQAVDEGDKARITLPMLTEQRRRELVKSLGKYIEQAKVGIRQARQEAMKTLKAASEEISEDEVKDWEKEIQKWTDKAIKEIDAKHKEKSDALMTI